MARVVAGDDEITRERTPRQLVGELFSSEEMQAIREQYEERVRLADERREELEWQVRLALARIRDAELGARRSADEMARVYATLAGLLGEGEPAAATPLRTGYRRMVA